MNNLNHMVWNNEADEYQGTLSDGTRIHVASDVWSEQKREGVSEQELVLPATWENCQDGEKVYVSEPETKILFVNDESSDELTSEELTMTGAELLANAQYEAAHQAYWNEHRGY